MASFKVQNGLRQTGQLQKAICIWLSIGGPTKFWHCSMIHLSSQRYKHSQGWSRWEDRCCFQAIVYKGNNVHEKCVEFTINCRLMQKAGVAVRSILWSNSEEGQNRSTRGTWKHNSLRGREWYGKDRQEHNPSHTDLSPVTYRLSRWPGRKQIQVPGGLSRFIALSVNK